MTITVLESVISGTTIASELAFVVVCVLKRGRRYFLWSALLYVAYHMAFSAWMLKNHLRRRELGVRTYYADVIVDLVLLAWVIAEIFFDDVRPFSTWPSKIKRGFVVGMSVGSTATVLLVASLRAFGVARRNAWDDLTDLITSLLVCTFLLISTLAAARLRTSSKNGKLSAMTQGLAIWACIALTVDLIHMNSMWAASELFDDAVGASWAFMVLWWTYTVWRPDEPNEGQRRIAGR